MKGATPLALLVLSILVALVLCTDLARGAELFTVDGAGRVAKAKQSRASLQRTPPTEAPLDPTTPHGDPDALRYLVAADSALLPALIDIASLDGAGEVIDRLVDVPLAAVPCPATVAAKTRTLSCAVTEPLRAVSDDIDRAHPLVRRRSLRAELGGAIVIMAGKKHLGRVRVTSPRQIGPIERYRARLRFVFVRLAPGGASVGGDERGAREIAARALDRAGGLWGACGVDLGAPGDVSVEVVDPPPPALLAVGCGHGLPASGGTLRFMAGTRRIEVATKAGQSPQQTARRVAAALRAHGLAPQIFDNPRMTSAAGASTDVMVRDAAGQLVALSPIEGPISDDATQLACIGHVHLEDGLTHFADVDASVGTLEERTLLRAIDDADPTTVEVVLIPAFARGGRIGESFIASDGGTIQNVVVVDHAGIQGGRSSFTLAHELGHVLLDAPGHPDDYGTDLPTRLMDADASDPTAFGPRRLSLEECRRAVRQSGPSAPVPILSPYPLEALPAELIAPAP